jgi:hypothetical protein
MHQGGGRMLWTQDMSLFRRCNVQKRLGRYAPVADLVADENARPDVVMKWRYGTAGYATSIDRAVTVILDHRRLRLRRSATMLKPMAAMLLWRFPTPLQRRCAP